MGRIEKTFFISYRRTNYWTALAVYQDLTAHGYDVFFDYQNIDSGKFEKVIADNIKFRAHFVLILSASALERCNEPRDWLRREIELAMDEKRNIVPVTMEGFDFGDPTIKTALSGKLAKLSSYNVMRLHADYFFEGIEKLRYRFLNIALEDVPEHTLGIDAQVYSQSYRNISDEVTPVEEIKLNAEEWFERGYISNEKGNFEDAARFYKEAIRLNPNHFYAHYNLGLLQQNILMQYYEAEIHFRKAIDLESTNALAYSNLGVLLGDLKQQDEAKSCYHKALNLIESSPAEDSAFYAGTYHNLKNSEIKFSEFSF